MSDLNVILPSKPRIVSESEVRGVFEIDALYPGYGHTLGSSLRRIILSSLPGAAITSVKINGISHEFTTIEGVKEDVITILLNLKKIRFQMLADEPQTMSFSIKGIKDITAADIETGGQVVVLNKEQHVASLTDKAASLNVEIRIEKGLGYLSREMLHKNRVDIGAISLDATFTPIRKASYEVENMRVGDRTDFNKLRIIIETDGTISPKEALEKSISIMIAQLKAVIGFKEEEVIEVKKSEEKAEKGEDGKEKREANTELLKTRIEDANLSPRTLNALSAANIRTVGGLARKKEEDLLDIDGLGGKGVQEIKKLLSGYGISLK
ncbi:TPA: DNA-directed RNA polymerase subunit alpha [Candidatus Taylorbacteria bacterium]|nr:DNA-directed RNA polymerase subunit alpha [Candidatus Taylorbacteria bacterium]